MSTELEYGKLTSDLNEPITTIGGRYLAQIKK